MPPKKENLWIQMMFFIDSQHSENLNIHSPGYDWVTPQ